MQSNNAELLYHIYNLYNQLCEDIAVLTKSPDQFITQRVLMVKDEMFSARLKKTFYSDAEPHIFDYDCVFHTLTDKGTHDEESSRAQHAEEIAKMLIDKYKKHLTQASLNIIQRSEQDNLCCVPQDDHILHVYQHNNKSYFGVERKNNDEIAIKAGAWAQKYMQLAMMRGVAGILLRSHGDAEKVVKKACDNDLPVASIVTKLHTGTQKNNVFYRDVRIQNNTTQREQRRTILSIYYNTFLSLNYDVEEIRRIDTAYQGLLESVFASFGDIITFGIFFPYETTHTTNKIRTESFLPESLILDTNSHLFNIKILKKNLEQHQDKLITIKMIYPTEDLTLAVELLKLLKDAKVNFVLFCLLPGHDDAAANLELSQTISDLPLIFKNRKTHDNIDILTMGVCDPKMTQWRAALQDFVTCYESFSQEMFL